MMDADTAMQFFELCIELKIETPEEKIQLLRELVKQRRATYLRNPKETIKGKKVWNFRNLGLDKLDYQGYTEL